MTARGFLTWKVHDAVQRLGAATTLESKLHWAKVLNEAKRARGDFDQVEQKPVSNEHVDALARHEAQASVQNLEGERHD
jgi:hypothetical protein